MIEDEKLTAEELAEAKRLLDHPALSEEAKRMIRADLFPLLTNEEAVAMPTGRDDIKLKSGRTVYAHCGIFGLEESGNGFEVTHGYGGYVGWPPAEWREPAPDTDLSADDMREIADMMLERWARFRASLPVSDREGVR